MGETFECIAKEPINAKGFSEPVPAFQVVGRFPEGSQEVSFQEEKPGFSLALDADMIQESDREEVIASLRAAISKLR